MSEDEDYDPGPSDETLVLWFPCKWCGDTLRIVRGYLVEHSCPVDHTMDEHLAYAMEQIESVGERVGGDNGS